MIDDSMGQWLDELGEVAAPGFAQRVADAWLDERGPGDADRDEEGEVEDAEHAEARGAVERSFADRLATTVAVVSALAAAAGILLFLSVPWGPVADGPVVSEDARAQRGGASVDPEATQTRETDPATGRGERPGDDGDDALDRLRAQTLQMLRTRCGHCHEGTHADAVPDALAVFDVTHSGWWQGLDARQLGVLSTRLEGQDTATADDRRVVAAFVESELAHRGTAIETPR